MFLRRVIFFSIVFLAVVSCKSKAKKSSGTTSGGGGGIYTVSGTVDGLIGTLVLQNNSGDNLSVSSDGSFSFATKLNDAATYSVTVLTNPTGQSCTVDSGASGTIAAGDVSDVVVNCVYEPSVSNCDSGLDLDSTDAVEGAAAMGICDGVTSASWEQPDGSTVGTPGFDLGHGISPNFGVNVIPQEGSSLLVLSTGTARSTSQPGYISPVGSGYSKGYSTILPSIPGIPSSGDGGLLGGACNAPPTTARDGIALKVNLTVPAGANAFRFDYRFFATDYPTYICSNYVDGTAAVLNSSDHTNQNILLTSLGNPLNVNTVELTNCTASGNYSCPMGTSALLQTGFESGAATNWMTMQAPVDTGDSVTLQFMIWDSSDGSADSTLVLDNFRWYSLGSRHKANGATKAKKNPTP